MKKVLLLNQHLSILGKGVGEANFRQHLFSDRIFRHITPQIKVLLNILSSATEGTSTPFGGREIWTKIRAALSETVLRYKASRWQRVTLTRKSGIKPQTGP